jgi:hypothetical protein
MITEMPNPTEEQMKSPIFNAIWEVIKDWDVNVPEYYEGYCGANGSHVALILEKIKEPVWGLVFECAGAATAPLLQDHPDYVFPSERVEESVSHALAEHGFTEPPHGYQ